MEKQFIYAQDKDTIIFLKEKFKVFYENDNGCYFFNDISNVDFDLSEVNETIVYTNSIDMELN